MVLGSGLTIAGATYCLSFARLPYFPPWAYPSQSECWSSCRRFTLGPAVIFVGSMIGRFERKRAARGRLWRRVGTAVVRWPAAILAVSTAIVLIGMIALPGYVTSYNDRYYLPTSAPSNLGYQAADRHFSQARMNPDTSMVEADHDMRIRPDMLVLDRVAKNVMRTVGIVFPVASYRVALPYRPIQRRRTRVGSHVQNGKRKCSILLASLPTRRTVVDLSAYERTGGSILVAMTTIFLLFSRINPATSAILIGN